MFEGLNIIGDLKSFMTPERTVSLVRALIVLVVGFPFFALLRRWVRSYVEKRYAQHYGMLAGKVVFYLGVVLIITVVLNQLGFSLAPLLGAAGIIGIAIGFASQTSVSNIISGLFLLAEQPFKVGDIITVGTTTGIVDSVDVLSVKLRTFDNKFVRMPNESLIKQELMNLTRYPIRRFNATVSVAYKEDIQRVREILLDVADKNEYCLKEPEPLIVLDMFGASSIDLLFLVWAETDHYLNLKTTINEEVKARFDAEGIEIPFPHLSLYAGSESQPIRVEQLPGGAEARSGS